MDAVLGLHYSVVHVVEEGGASIGHWISTFVASDAPLVWTADVINCMSDPFNLIDEDHAMLGTPQAISTSSCHFVCVN